MSAATDGLILGLGMGYGRTDDHRCHRLPRRSVYMFDREVAAQPDCEPLPEMLRLGDVRQTLPVLPQLHHGSAVFVNSDLRSADKAASVHLANRLAPTLREILAPRARPASGQKKAPSCDEALKGSLNRKVSKGPEETTRKNCVCDPLRSVCQGFPSMYRGPTPKYDNAFLL